MIAPAPMILVIASSSLCASTIITLLQGAGHANVYTIPLTPHIMGVAFPVPAKIQKLKKAFANIHPRVGPEPGYVNL